MGSRAGVLTGLHVLVVDDNADARDLLRFVLAYFGAFVTTAASVPEAMDLLASIAPHVVITDVFLGADDGREFLLQARSRGVRAPFIAISTGDFDRYDLGRAGFAAYLRKPLEHNELVDTILGVVNH